MDQRAIIAASRFGLGPRPDQPITGDPVAWLERQLGPVAAPPLPAGWTVAPTLADGFAAFRADREANRSQPAAVPGGAPGAPAPLASMPGAQGMADPAMPPSGPGAPANVPAGTPPQPGRPPGGRRQVGELFRAEAAAWAEHAVTTTTPFRERLVQFWFNHFTVSRRRGEITAITGCYIREAIRPHIVGKFSEMLLAVARHPAMLIYLDNAASIGPGSPAGQRTGRGLNENLAREILELHTVSPAAGYSQQDVTEFAKVITGWSVEREREPVGFLFRPRAHEPGAKQVMGRTYEEGEAGGVAALRWLGTHPATCKHLATKLVRHFVADQPPPRAVERIAAVLRETGGDLGAAARALIRLPEAWTPLAKVRSAQDFVFAALRAVGAGPAAGLPAMGALAALGQAPWNAPGPNGWDDTAAEWAAPEAMMRRIDLVWTMAGRAAAAGALDPRAVAETALGPLARPATLEAVARAGSVRDALTLLLGSPEFQRR